MTPKNIIRWNKELGPQSPLEVTRWAVAQARGRAIVSTNFRPYEAVVLHLATLVQPDIPVLWVDHGYNRPATYRHAERLRGREVGRLRRQGRSPHDRHRLEHEEEGRVGHREGGGGPRTPGRPGQSDRPRAPLGGGASPSVD